MKNGRLKREKKTINAMLKLYCKDNHNSSNILCDKCSSLLAYANNKIEKCCFKEKKPVCSDCKIHCYSKENREAIKLVMRYSGPRIMLSNPYLAIMHFVDKWTYKE